MKTVEISDMTLRLAEGGSALSFKERVEIARTLDRLGTDQIELPALKDDKGGIVSVLVADDFDLKDLHVGPSDEAPQHVLESTFRIAPRYEDRTGTFFRTCRPGVYDLYVSAGRRDGTPVYALPYEGDDGKRRYRLGRIEVTE